MCSPGFIYVSYFDSILKEKADLRICTYADNVTLYLAAPGVLAVLDLILAGVVRVRIQIAVAALQRFRRQFERHARVLLF